MYRLLSPSLGRGLLRAAGRRCRTCSARLLPGPAGGRAPEVTVPAFRVAPRGGGPGLLPLLAGEGRGPGGAGRAGTGAQAGPGDLRAPSRSARLVLEARCGRRAGGAAGSGRGRRRGRGGRDRGRDHPAAEESQGEAAFASRARSLALRVRSARSSFPNAGWGAPGVELPGIRWVMVGCGGAVLASIQACQTPEPAVRPLQSPVQMEGAPRASLFYLSKMSGNVVVFNREPAGLKRLASRSGHVCGVQKMHLSVACAQLGSVLSLKPSSSPRSFLFCRPQVISCLPSGSLLPQC